MFPPPVRQKESVCHTYWALLLILSISTQTPVQCSYTSHSPQLCLIFFCQTNIMPMNLSTWTFSLLQAGGRDEKKLPCVTHSLTLLFHPSDSSRGWQSGSFVTLHLEWLMMSANAGHRKLVTAGVPGSLCLAHISLCLFYSLNLWIAFRSGGFPTCCPTQLTGINLKSLIRTWIIVISQFAWVRSPALQDMSDFPGPLLPLFCCSSKAYGACWYLIDQPLECKWSTFALSPAVGWNSHGSYVGSGTVLIAA